MDRWVRELCLGTPSNIPYVPWCPLELRDGMDKWDRELCWRTPSNIPVPWCPLGTERWDSQVGQEAVLRDPIRHPLLSHGVPWGLRVCLCTSVVYSQISRPSLHLFSRSVHNTCTCTCKRGNKVMFYQQ